MKKLSQAPRSSWERSLFWGMILCLVSGLVAWLASTSGRDPNGTNGIQSPTQASFLNHRTAFAYQKSADATRLGDDHPFFVRLPPPLEPPPRGEPVKLPGHVGVGTGGKTGGIGGQQHGGRDETRGTAGNERPNKGEQTTSGGTPTAIGGDGGQGEQGGDNGHGTATAGDQGTNGTDRVTGANDGGAVAGDEANGQIRDGGTTPSKQSPIPAILHLGYQGYIGGSGYQKACLRDTRTGTDRYLAAGMSFAGVTVTYFDREKVVVETEDGHQAEIYISETQKLEVK